MSSDIVLHSAFDPKRIVFAKTPAKTSKGSKICYVNFDTGARVRLQTPVMRAPFGISTFDEASSGLRSYSLDGSFHGYETNQPLASFLEKCRALDDCLIDAATAHSRDWFGKASSRDVIEELVRKLVRDPSDPSKYAPTIRMKVATNPDGSPATLFFDADRNPVDMDYLVRGSTFRAIVEVSSVWFVQKSFGITLRLSQVIVLTRPDNAAPQKLTDFSFVDDGGDEAMADADATAAADAMKFV